MPVWHRTAVQVESAAKKCRAHKGQEARASQQVNERPSPAVRVSGAGMRLMTMPPGFIRPAALALGGVLMFGGCPKKAPVQQKPEVDPATLFLEPVPAITGVLELDGSERRWSGPTRVMSSDGREPWKIDLEDFDKAEPFEICIESTEPVAFCQAAEAMKDTGTVGVDGDRLTIDLKRVGYDEKVREIRLSADLSPEAVPRPDDWLKSGTMLYYGRAFDHKPITKNVPMALNVRIGTASDGGRVLSWTADIDVLEEVEITGASTRSGRLLLSASVVESTSKHSDAFASGEGINDDAGSLFLSRKTIADAIMFGGAPLHDQELSKEGVLVVTGQTTVRVQVDDGLWDIPALVAVVNSGEGVYVVADDPANPLILSAIRPGYRMRLMALGSPSRD